MCSVWVTCYYEVFKIRLGLVFQDLISEEKDFKFDFGFNSETVKNAKMGET